MVGPALTFRIRQNERNMTAAEVAAKAGEAGKHTCPQKAEQVSELVALCGYPLNNVLPKVLF